ncbi:MAG TPA: hypothetical protein VE222_11710 [Nitrospiraceae bacterium]|nr:hypothetical protein [Nitrospiraceae bacterium]
MNSQDDLQKHMRTLQQVKEQLASASAKRGVERSTPEPNQSIRRREMP